MNTGRVIRSRSLLVRLLAAYLLPTLGLLGIFGWLAYQETRQELEESLGRRLVVAAQAAAVQVNPRAVLFLSPGDETSRTAKRLMHKLGTLKDRTGVARLVILDRKLHCRIDTRGTMRIGDHYYHAEADRPELDRVFSGQGASSVLFRGAGGKMYKTGYAPVLDGPKVVAAVAAVGSAEFFTVLARLRNYLLLSGGVVASLVVLVTLLLARRITRPLRLLAGEARRIGAGDLQQAIQATSRDEVGLLADTMNEMREGLFQRDQQMQMMLSGIAHEVRNPLGGIELFSGLLRDDLAGDPAKLEKLARIERELSYLKKVVEDFLDFARRRPLSKSSIDLRALARETVELLAGEAASHEVELLVSGEAAPCSGDAEQLRRVLINLTKNAIQASERGGQVTLRGQAAGAVVILEVEDHGAGISPEQIRNIFTPFYTSREKGTGLGLALVRKIIEEHGGEITVRSEPEQGSLFRVQLPAILKE